MPRARNILVVCRSVDELRLFCHVKIEPQNKYIIASDDLRVHWEVEKYSWVDRVSFITQEKSFYGVAKDVVKILDVMNIWLKSLGDNKHGIPKELLFWIRHAEGGMTTKRIEDILLLIQSYLYLINKNNIKHVIIISHPKSHWVDSVLIQTAQSRNVDVQIIGRFRIKVLLQRAVNFFYPIALELYFILNISWAKLRSLVSHKRHVRYKKEIVIQLCSSAQKHLVLHIPLMKALEKKGYKPVGLCWGAYKGAKQLRREKLRADELEKWVPVSAIFISLFKVFKTWKCARERWKEMLTNLNLDYQSVHIAKMIWPSINYFFIADLAQRYRLMIASKKYFEVFSPLAIKPWTLIFPEAVIPCIHINKKDVLIFHLSSPLYHSSENPYQHHVIEPDLVLTSGIKQEKQLAKMGFSRNKMISTGEVHLDNVSSFINKYNPDQSRSFLKVPSIYSTYFFYDPSYIKIGVLAPSEQVRTTDFLLNFARKHPFVALIIKPHPAHNSGVLESHIKHYSLSNVFLINHKVLPNHCLNAADIVITKFSAIGIEAMENNCPVISVILDNEKRFKLFGNGAEYVYTIKELNNLLSKIVNDEDYKCRWSSVQKERSKYFLNESVIKNKIKCGYELTAEAIDVSINGKQSYNFKIGNEDK